MGLIYSAGDSTALVVALTANLASATRMLESTESACTRLSGALGGGELSGKGYSAVGSLFSQAIQPRVSDAKTVIAAIQTDLDAYAQADSTVSLYGSLNEDELNAQLRSVRAQRDATERQIESNESMIRVMQSMPAMPVTVVALQMANSKLEVVLAGLEADITELEKKLKALRDFSSNTSGLFSLTAEGSVTFGSRPTCQTGVSSSINKKLDSSIFKDSDFFLLRYLHDLRKYDREAYWELLAELSVKDLERLEEASYLDALEPTREEPRGGKDWAWLKRLLKLTAPFEGTSWKSPLTRIKPEAWAKDDWLKIRQGGIGDCWLVAALDVELRDNPNWVKDNVTVNSNGTVTVKLIDPTNGKWVKVTVTERLLHAGTNDSSMLFGVREPDIAAYIEKASADFYNGDDLGHPAGSYASISGDYPYKAIEMFSGRETEQVSALGGASELQAALEHGKSAIVSSPAEVPVAAEDRGFIGSHAYVVDRVDDGKIYLLNPWNPAKEEYKVTLTFDEYEDWANEATIIDKVKK